MVESLIEIAKINQWANSLFRENLKENFEHLKTLETPYGSFGEIVYHLFGSVYFWLRRTGKFDFDIKRYQDISNTDELFSLWELVDKSFVEFLEKVEDKNSILKYVTSKGDKNEIVLNDLVTQLNNHSYYHRGQIAYFSRLNGSKLPQTDALVYYRTMR